MSAVQEVSKDEVIHSNTGCALSCKVQKHEGFLWPPSVGPLLEMFGRSSFQQPGHFGVWGPAIVLFLELSYIDIRSATNDDGFEGQHAACGDKGPVYLGCFLPLLRGFLHLLPCSSIVANRRQRKPDANWPWSQLAWLRSPPMSGMRSLPRLSCFWV